MFFPHGFILQNKLLIKYSFNIVFYYAEIEIIYIIWDKKKFKYIIKKISNSNTYLHIYNLFKSYLIVNEKQY